MASKRVKTFMAKGSETTPEWRLVDATGQTHDRALQAGATDLLPQEVRQDALDEWSVNVQIGRRESARGFRG